MQSNAIPSIAAVDTGALWQLSRGYGQRIALIDTGVTPHRRLPSVIAGGDYVSSGDGLEDCDGHGTMVAGIIAGTPDPADVTGFSGIAPDADLISIRQSSTKFGALTETTTNGFGDVDTLAMAVRTATDMGASVINISTVACSTSPPDDRALGAALAYAVDVKDAVVVTAAGNVGDGGQCPTQNSSPPTVFVTPAWYDDYVLTVGSVGTNGAPSMFSLHGPWVDIAAPGENIVSLSTDGTGTANRIATPAGLLKISGTSYAAPIVAGLAALIRSRFPRLSARQVLARIEETAKKPPEGWNPAVGNGVLDPIAALTDSRTIPSQQPSKAITKSAPPQSVRTTESAKGNGTAIAGAGICLALLTVLVFWPRFSRSGSKRVTLD
jgi:membrane-anchored mycosin MYCP